MASAAAADERTGLGWVGAAAQERPEAEPESVWSEWSRTVDHWTITACFALLGVGMVLAFATSPDLAQSLSDRRGVELDSFHFAYRHLAAVVCAAMIFLMLSFLSPSDVRRCGVVLALCGLVCLILVLLLGEEHGKSARRWFSIGGVSIQPSEFLKPGLVVLSAWLLSALSQANASVGRQASILSCALAAGAVLLLILQPDYGQSALIIAVWAAMYFVAGGSVTLLAGVGIAAAAVGYAAYLYEPHIAARIDAFLDPNVAAHSQLAEAERAIVSGGWLGVGVGEGVRKAFLPDAHADFVIAVAAEEYGFGMVALIVSMIGLVTLRAIWRASDMADPFARIAISGLAFLFGMQAVVHLGVSAQLLPATGMTLPFVSYGGSSMLATAIGVGLMLALTRRPAPMV